MLEEHLLDNLNDRNNNNDENELLSENDNNELLSENVKVINETVEPESFLLRNTVEIKVEANKLSIKKTHKINKMSDAARLAAEEKEISCSEETCERMF